WRNSPSASQQVQRRIGELELKKGDLETKVEAAKRSHQARPLLHPEMSTLYRDWVVEARDGLRDPDKRTGAVSALRRIVEKVVLTPQGGVLGIELKGDLASMLAAASPKAEAEDLRRQV